MPVLPHALPTYGKKIRLPVLMGADFRARKQKKGRDFRIMRAIEVIAVGTDRNQYSGLSVPMPAK